MATSARPMTIIRSSATASASEPVTFTNEVVKLIDVSKCIGCKACQSACLEWNDRHEEVGVNEGAYQNPHDLTSESWTLMRFAEYDNPQTGEFEWLIRKDGCMHCADPGCLKACPAPGAIVQYANGVVDFDTEKCIGCGYCLKGCPFDIPRISHTEAKAHKCTLCSDRVAVGQGPACAKACPTHAITFGEKDAILAHAETRITDLKSRGYAKAGLYNPEGVGGTHVMYVLHHADQPELYSGLPAHPIVSPLIKIWKGVSRYAGLAAIAGAVVAGLIHHVITGPNRVTDDEEEKARRLLEKRS